MEKLKEHRNFRNQMIIASLLLVSLSWFVPEFLIFGIMYGILGIWNILSYRENVKDYNKLKMLRDEPSE